MKPVNKVEYAIRIAGLWRAGKLIGADEDEIRDTLLEEIERLRIENSELRKIIDSNRGNE